MTPPISPLIPRHSNYNHWTLVNSDLCTVNEIMAFVSQFSFPKHSKNPVVYRELSDGSKERIVVGEKDCVYLLESSKNMADPEQFAGAVKTGRGIVWSNHPLFEDDESFLALHNRKPLGAISLDEVARRKEEMLHGVQLAMRLFQEGVSNIITPLEILHVFTQKGREKTVLIYPRYPFNLMQVALKSRGAPTLSLPETLSIQIDLARVVHKMVCRGIVCRDLKLANVLLRPVRSLEGSLVYECALTDLDQSSVKRIEPKRCWGSPKEMPPEYTISYALIRLLEARPEIAIPKEVIDLVVDQEKGPVFALGSIYYNMLKDRMGTQMDHLREMDRVFDLSLSNSQEIARKTKWLSPEFMTGLFAKLPDLQPFLPSIEEYRFPFAPCPKENHPIVHLITDMLHPDPSRRPSLLDVRILLEGIYTQHRK